MLPSLEIKEMQIERKPFFTSQKYEVFFFLIITSSIGKGMVK